MRKLWSSLRFRLAVGGFVAIYVPVLLLFAAVFASSIEEESIAADTSNSEAASSESGGEATISPWVVATAIGLIPLSAGISWWWAGRAVRPIKMMQAMADEIDGGDFDRRLDIADGPTEVVTLAASFDAMQDRLHRAAAAQRQFIEDTSHELRTPLAVLETNADVTLAAPEPTLESYAKALRRSKDTARRLSALVDELLVDARGKSRTIDRRPADLVELAKEAIDAVAPLAIERRVVLQLEAPRAVPCAVDRVSIVRALRNLVDNAVRYGGTDATVEVNVAAERGDAVVSVSDSGPGIPTDEQEAIFQRFWRTRSDQAGSGLGLPIVHQIAEAHGGSITVRSPGSRGDGSSFELRVPLQST